MARNGAWIRGSCLGVLLVMMRLGSLGDRLASPDGKTCFGFINGLVMCLMRSIPPQPCEFGKVIVTEVALGV
jgi:hypothetical protein